MSVEEMNKYTEEAPEKTTLQGSSELLQIHTKGTEFMGKSACLVLSSSHALIRH